MKILVINAGSSSLKYQLIEMDNETLLAKGQCERIGMDGSFIKQAVGENKIQENVEIPDHKRGIELVLDKLISKECGCIESLSEINAIGHRVVHGGETFTGSVLVDDDVMNELNNKIPLAPLHMPANILGIKCCMEVMPGVPNVAVFDTAFHSTMSKEVFLYGLPYEAYTDWQIRRYGFHGSSHKFVSEEVGNFLGVDITKLKIIICHLGNGSSISAVKNGKSIDTSMGFTPLEGLIMGTRAGDMDPAIIEYLMGQTGWDIHEATNYLNKKSGLLGITGTSSDMRDLCENLGKNPRADLALNMLAYRVKKYIGAYSAAMGGLDVLVFTGGIGENTPELREIVCNNMEYLGVELNDEVNYHNVRGENVDMTGVNSKVKVLRLPTNEEIEIARETKKLL